jgi:hypothetical protein
LYFGVAATYNCKIGIQLELGSTATAYEPYAGQTYSTPLGQTVYGGTLNVTTGVLTIDRAMVDLGTLTWRARTTGSVNKLYSSALPYNYVTTYSTLHGWVSDIYVEGAPANAGQLTTNIDTTQANTVHAFIQDGGVDNTIYLVVPVGGTPSGTLVYKVATPQTYHLTATQVSTLLGQNNIFADAGEVSVLYRADVGLYIDKKLAQALNA